MNDQLDSLKQRDAMTLRVLGGFFALMGILVFSGAFFTETRPALVVNLCAAALLLAAGVCGWVVADRIAKR